MAKAPDTTTTRKRIGSSERERAAAYDGVRGLLYGLGKRYGPGGQDFEDTLAEANLLFVKALNTHDPEKGALTTHLHWTVRGGLQDLAGRQRRKPGGKSVLRFSEIGTNEDGDGKAENALADTPKFSDRIRQLFADLSDDARVVVQLALDPARSEGIPPKARRHGIVDVLMAIGWSAHRVLKAFCEVREALV